MAEDDNTRGGGFFVGKKAAPECRRNAEKFEEVPGHHHRLEVDGQIAAGQRHAVAAIAGYSLDHRRAAELEEREIRE